MMDWMLCSSLGSIVGGKGLSGGILGHYGWFRVYYEIWEVKGQLKPWEKEGHSPAVGHGPMVNNHCNKRSKGYSSMTLYEESPQPIYKPCGFYKAQIRFGTS